MCVYVCNTGGCRGSEGDSVGQVYLFSHSSHHSERHSHSSDHSLREGEDEKGEGREEGRRWRGVGREEEEVKGGKERGGLVS